MHADQLRRSAVELAAALTEQLSDVIAIINEDEVLTYVSPSVEHVLGYKPEEQLGLTLSKALHVHPEDRARLTAALDQLARTGRSDHVECRFKHRGGRWRTCEVAGKNLLHDEQMRGLVINLHDITERKRMEQELAQLNRLTSLGRLSAQVAHEFNNVLMGIQPIVEEIRWRMGDDPMLLRFIDVISGSIARGKRITSDILRFGRPARLALRSVAVHEFVSHAADEIRPSLPPEIVMDLVIAEQPMFVCADPAQFAQVLVNLALNARQAMQQRGGTLSIAARPAEPGEVRHAERFIHFTVSDTGSGIAPDDLPYIFEPLFTTKKSGTGLGLSVVMQIVAAHGGHISVDSDVGGTTFHLFIPAAAPEDEIKSIEPPQPPRPSRQLRVLVVEDEEAVANGLQWGLEGRGMIVRVVNTGAGVLPAIAEFEPDIAVLDLALPDEDGRSVFTRIAAHHDLPVVFSSGHASDVDVEKLVDPERAAFLMKPYSIDELLRTMQRLVRKETG